VYDLIRERHPQMLAKIIFMTGGMFTERAARFRASVQNTFLSKPLDVRQIRQAMAGASAGPAPLTDLLR
jgi:hypothetical protein